MLSNLLAPKVDFASLILRLGLAAIFLVHGAFKIAQDDSLIPDYLTWEGQNIVGWAELICGGLLAVGLLSRLAALVLIVLQVGAIAIVTGPGALTGPPILKQGADFRKVGPEYNMALITMCLAVMLLGSGLVSLDHLLKNWLQRQKGQPVREPVAGSAS